MYSTCIFFPTSSLQFMIFKSFKFHYLTAIIRSIRHPLWFILCPGDVTSSIHSSRLSPTVSPPPGRFLPLSLSAVATGTVRNVIDDFVVGGRGHSVIKDVVFLQLVSGGLRGWSWRVRPVFDGGFPPGTTGTKTPPLGTERNLSSVLRIWRERKQLHVHVHTVHSPCSLINDRVVGCFGFNSSSVLKNKEINNNKHVLYM